MAHDDWRIRIELPDDEGARGLLERLGIARRDAEELADELREHRLAVSRDRNTVFVYAASGMQAEQATRIVEQELREAGLEPSRFVLEGTESRRDAVELARRIHGRVEPGGELVYEVQPQNPFAVFGGLGT